ncbi:MAG: glycosyltransferase family 4 protein [Candidatus Saccharimonadales bacterium]
MKIVSVTCYFDPHYIRSRVLEQALTSLPDVELISVCNNTRGLGRYPEVLLKLLRLRFSNPKPDAYLLNFRGYELLPFVLLLAGKTPVIFDEFINPVEVLTEHRQQRAGTLVGAVMGGWLYLAKLYYLLLRRCTVILADTEPHKVYTASLSKLPLERYVAIPVSTDETLFTTSAIASDNKPAFQVFYYGSMVPLHGVAYLIEAAELLKDIPEITFLIAGKTARYADTIAAANAAGAHVTCLDWIDFNDVPRYIQESAVCVAGPFGGTVQAQYVVTGKTYQFLASRAVALVGENQATAMFEDKVNALVVPQANAQALADSIRWAYEHQAELTTMATNGRTLYEDNFSSRVVAQALQTILKKLA